VYISAPTPYFGGKGRTATSCTLAAYFGTRPQDVNEVFDIDIDKITRELSAKVEHWNSRGSGFIIERVSNFVLRITKFRPLHGSSYIPTPKRILDKVCTINVKNRDQKCFVWSVLASLYPASDHVNEPYKYFPYEHSLNTTNLNFPLALKDIPKLEILNPSVESFHSYWGGSRNN